MKRNPTAQALRVVGLFLLAMLCIQQKANGQDSALDISDVQFKSEDQIVIGKLYRVKEMKGTAPAIVALPGRGRDFASMDWLYKPLAQKGFVVMPISFRDIPVRYYLKDVEDARNAMTYLESLPFVEKSRFGIYGHSRGGAAALMTAASGDKRVRSVVSASAPTDHFKSLAEKEPSAAHYPDRMRTRGVPPAEDPAYYRSVSAIYHANQMRDVPILLIHGAQDFLTFLDHSTNMYGALKVAGNREARIEVIVGAGHFYERGMRGYAFDEVVGHALPWFERTLRAAK
jgi:dipeptidyl aminopeptidase/acylaminoacyl peptidase